MLPAEASPLAAILQVVSIGLFWAGGMLSLYQFGFDASLLRELDLARRADEISKKAAMMAACILGVLALNPVFAGGYVANNPNNPVQLLSLIVSVPAVVLLLFVTTSAKVRRLHSMGFRRRRRACRLVLACARHTLYVRSCHSHLGVTRGCAACKYIPLHRCTNRLGDDVRVSAHPEMACGPNSEKVRETGTSPCG